MVAAPNGDLVVLASGRATAQGGASWAVLRYRAAGGALLWSRVRASTDVAGKPTDTGAHGLAVDAAGSVYVAGFTHLSDDSPGVAIAEKCFAAGRPVWRFAGDGAGYANNCFTVICAGGVLAGGSLATTTGETSSVQRLRP